VRAAVIGVGYLGKHHARIYSELGDVELAAVVDLDGEKAGAIAAPLGSLSSTDYRDVLPNVDIISIVTPTTTHFPIALECLRAGKDLLIEKPITVTVEEADILEREAEKRGLILQVGHLERYNPAVLAASSMIDEPLFMESERLSPFMGRGTDVDVTLDLMIHDVDIMLSLMPFPLKEVKAVGAKVLTEKFDVAKAWLEFENGSAALATVSRLSGEKVRKLRVFQEDSYVLVDYQHAQVRRYFRGPDGISSEVITPAKTEPLKEELADFVRCVRERARPKVSAAEGRNALRVVMEINEKIRRTGGRVH
jgi:predicted dehydrogenase